MVVITALTMLFIIGLAFFVLSQAERVSSIRHLDSIRARYIAEAGIAYAQQVLKLDRNTNLIDSLKDITYEHFKGDEVDLDQDGQTESRWFNVNDSQGNLCGRFAIKITDEASKMNLNSTSIGALKQLCSNLGMDSAKTNAIVSKRPFNAIEQLGVILGKDDFKHSKDFFTVYSLDKEIDLDRRRRSYLNSTSAQVLLEAFLSAGINNAYQKAANLKDASDGDLAQTVFDKFVLGNLAPNGLIEPGGWRNVGGFYEAQAGSSAGRFVWSNLALEDGEYFCFLYGPDASDVVGEVEGKYIYSGDGLINKVKVEGGGFSLQIKPAKDRLSRFSHIELEGLAPKSGLTRKVVTGVEAVVINELMVKPAKEITIDAPDILPAETFRYTFTQLKPGDYYIVVLAKKTGGLVGDVTIYGDSASNLRDGDYFPLVRNVNSSGDLTIEIKNNSLGTSTFRGIKILQEPDAEFIEVLNLSPSEIDLSKFYFEVFNLQGELVPGWPGRIPDGTTLGPYQYLVFTVDNTDVAPTPVRLRNNGLCFKKVWGFNGTGLIFDEYSDTIDKNFDLLPDVGARVILRDASGRQVDAVEYQGFQVSDFISLERGCPAIKSDSDGNGFFDGWYASEDKNLATPSSINENIGMYTFNQQTGERIKHSPGEIIVFNRNLSGLSEVLELSSSRNWEKFSILDLSRMADRFSSEAVDLNLSGNYKGGDFKEIKGAFESTRIGESGVWEFSDIHTGNYLLSISSENFSAEGQRIEVSYKGSQEGEFSIPSSLLFANGIAFYGRVELTGDDLCPLQLKIINASDVKLRINAIRLEPVYSVPGRININTAKAEVLKAVFDSDKLVNNIISNRPIGMKDGRKLGIGELFLLDEAYLPFYNSLTVKSDVYEINSRGEYFKNNNTLAYQTIRAVIERGD